MAERSERHRAPVILELDPKGLLGSDLSAQHSAMHTSSNPKLRPKNDLFMACQLSVKAKVGSTAGPYRIWLRNHTARNGYGGNYTQCRQCRVLKINNWVLHREILADAVDKERLRIALHIIVLAF